MLTNALHLGHLAYQQRCKGNKDSVGAYAVQCGECSKWRFIPTKEEFESIRHNFIENPWYCYKKPGASCDDPADLEYDNTRIWVIDKPNIPKAPPNTERMLIMRRDCSKMDAHYIMPNGKKVRSGVEVEKFLEAYPEYKGKISPSSFSFTVPKVMDERSPRKFEEKASPSSNKRLKISTKKE